MREATAALHAKINYRNPACYRRATPIGDLRSESDPPDWAPLLGSSRSTRLTWAPNRLGNIPVPTFMEDSP